MSNHHDFDLHWYQNVFLNSNFDRRSKFKKSAECRIMMILTCAGLRIHFWDQISIEDRNLKNRLNFELLWFWLALISESISELKFRLQIKISKIIWMSNHHDFDLHWYQNVFLNSNLDRRSKFPKSAEYRIIMILIYVQVKIHFWTQISITDQNFKNPPNVESWWF